MDKIYNCTFFRFAASPSLRRKKLKWWQQLITGTLKLIIPVANPSYESRFDEVHNWLVEFERPSGIPTREIGLNKKDEVIMIMPYGKNYGYWTDSHLLLKDFVRDFQPAVISQEYSNSRWKEVDS